jgi:hypothetical protein
MSDFHSHKCDECGTRWDHERLVGVSEKRYEAAHRCPECGEVQYMKYFGPGTVQTAAQAEALHSQRPPMSAELARLFAFLTEGEDDSDGDGDEGNWA